MDCNEFWELLLYLGEHKIDDRTLPHWTKLTAMILEEYKKEHQKITESLSVSRLIPFPIT